MRVICAVRRSAAPAALAAALLVPAGAYAAGTGSASFTETGEHAFTVPAGVTSMQVRLTGGSGARGGAGNSGFHAPGGIGATATATIAVSPGEILFAEVAGNGQAGGAGGYGGGGSSSHSGETGGGGGGASDVRSCSATASPSSCAGGSSLASRLVVAAGGGGGGRGGGDTGDSAVIMGGAGGTADAPGGEGAFDPKGDNGGEGGRAGGANAPGAAGGNSAEPATSGQLGLGGSGGGSLAAAGGGGGGGVFGGGGGGGGLAKEAGGNVFNSAGGGGGGGGSGATMSLSIVAGFRTEPTTPGTQPSVTFTWTLPAPAASTGLPSGVTSGAATVNGTVNPNGSVVSECHFTISPAGPAGASVPCQQQVGAGSTPLAVSAAVAGLTPATTYTVTLIAASAQGTGAGSAVTFSTPAGPTGSGPGLGSGSGTAPTVTNLRLTPTRFRRGRRRATIARAGGLASATKISFALSAAARVTLSFERAQPGVLVGHRCLAPSTIHRRGHRCTRFAAVPHAVALAAHAGADTITFDGLLDGGGRLAPGAYRLTLVASAGTAHATAAQHPTFNLLGP